MKKHIKTLVAALLLCTILILPVLALPSDIVGTDNHSDVEVSIISENITPEKEVQLKNVILADLGYNLIQGNPEIKPFFNLLCLFGHDIGYAVSYVTTHNYYSTNPRCKIEIYDLTYCKRSGCDYSTATYVGSSASSCH